MSCSWSDQMLPVKQAPDLFFISRFFVGGAKSIQSCKKYCRRKHLFQTSSEMFRWRLFL